MSINSVSTTTNTSYTAVRKSTTKSPMSLEEFTRRVSGRIGSTTSFIDNCSTVEGNIAPIGLWPDEEFSSKEDLYKKLAAKYDMKNLRNGDLTRIIATLHDAGFLSDSEAMYAYGPIPVLSLDETGAASGTSLTAWEEPQRSGPQAGYNALSDYKQRYADYIYKHCQSLSPSVTSTVQNAMAAHSKVEAILQEIQSYR